MTTTTTQQTTTTTQPGTTVEPETSTVVCDQLTGNDEGTCVLSLSDGTTITGFLKQGVVQFKYIPYAQAPVGDRRWKAAEIITR